MLRSLLCRCLCLVVVLCLPLVACSPQAPEAPVAPAEDAQASMAQLEERVRQRWQALVARDFLAVWEFETPHYRSRFPQKLYPYNYSYALKWELTSIEVVNYDAEAAMASVAVRVMSEPTKQTSVASRAIGALPATIREQWLYIDSEWWHSANL